MRFMTLTTESRELLLITKENWNERNVRLIDNKMMYRDFVVTSVSSTYEFDRLFNIIKELSSDNVNKGIEYDIRGIRKINNIFEMGYITPADHNSTNISVPNDFADDVQKYISCLETKEFGNISDGYHTFDELYYHRMVLFSVICNNHKALAWKSKKHDDGSMFDDMFIVGIETPEGPATYHYYDKYWNMFNVRELPFAPKWDGHSPEDAIRRIESLN